LTRAAHGYHSWLDAWSAQQTTTSLNKAFMDLMSTAQLLGNFGEFVGSIAILVTLVYLSIQVRKSQIAAEADSVTAAQSNAWPRVQFPVCRPFSRLWLHKEGESWVYWRNFGDEKSPA